MQKSTAALVAGSAVLASAIVGAQFSPAPTHPRTAFWYAMLRKPGYTPSGPAIGAAWMVLDSLLCVSGYRLLTARPSEERRTALVAWGASVAGVAAHPSLFFGRRNAAVGLGVVAGMTAAATLTAAKAARVDRVAAISSLPLIAWTLFAALLNEEIVRKN